MIAQSCVVIGLRGAKGAGERPASSYDDGQLPWLQAVEDEDEPRGVSARKMLAALLVVLLRRRCSSPRPSSGSAGATRRSTARPS